MNGRIDPPTEQEAVELEDLRAGNEETMNRLAAQGLPIDLNGGLLDHLINELIPEGTWWRHEFCMRWEQRAAEILADIESKVRKRQLLIPGSS